MSDRDTSSSILFGFAVSMLAFVLGIFFGAVVVAPQFICAG